MSIKDCGRLPMAVGWRAAIVAMMRPMARIRHFGVVALVLAAPLLACARADAGVVPGGALFTLAGGDDASAPLRSGQRATDVPVAPDAIVGLPDGGFAFFDYERTQVLRVDAHGRIAVLAGDGETGSGGDGGPAVKAHLWWGTSLAVSPDGLLIGDGIAGTIRLVRPDGIIVKIAGNFGEDSQLAVTASGDILVANPSAGVIRRIARSGAITTFAHLQAPTSVAVAADGSVYVTDDGVLLRILADGTVTTVAQPFAYGLLAIGPGGLFAGGGLQDTDTVATIGPSGVAIVVAGGDRDTDFDDDGTPSPSQWLGGSPGVGAAADGGLLISSNRGVLYLPPEQPQRLAVAIARPTLTSPRRLAVSLTTTRPAAITIRARRHSGGAMALHSSVPTGHSTLTFAHRLPADAYTVHVTARGADGQVATDQQVVFLGGRIDLETARALAADQARSDEVLQAGTTGSVGACRRYGARRIDCEIRLDGSCYEIYTMHLGRDGLIDSDVYGDVACRFRR